MAKIATMVERLNELFDSDPRNDSSIADFLGVSKQTISAWKNGTRSPKRSHCKKIAEYYNVSEEWLFGWDMDVPALKSQPLHPDVVSMLDKRIEGLNEQQTKLNQRRQEELTIIDILNKVTDEGRAYILQQAEIALKLYRKD